jgi:antitoxin HicB
MATYSVILIPADDEGRFTVRVPAIPSLVTSGENRQHALDMARDEIELYLSAVQEKGWDWPGDCGTPEVATVEVMAVAEAKPVSAER